MEVMNFWKEILHMCSRRILQGAALVIGCWRWCSWYEYVLGTCLRESRSAREAWHQYCAAADEQNDAKKKGASLKVPHPWQDCKTQHLLWRRSMNWTTLLLLHAFPVLTRGSADGPYPSLIGALFLLAALAGCFSYPSRAEPNRSQYSCQEGKRKRFETKNQNRNAIPAQVQLRNVVLEEKKKNPG